MKFSGGRGHDQLGVVMKAASRPPVTVVTTTKDNVDLALSRHSLGSSFVVNVCSHFYRFF